MANNQRRTSGGIGGGIIGILMVVALVMFAWFAVKSIWSILLFVAPILFIATLFMKRSVVFDYVKAIGSIFKENPGKGLLYGAGSVLLYPLVSAFLFVKALMVYQIEKRFGKKEEEKYSEYEEVEEQEVDEEDFLELPEIEKAEPMKESNNEYDDLL